MKKVLVLSDLHLGSPNCNARQVLRVLNEIPFDLLIINGDAYDHLNLHRLRHHHREVLARIWELSNNGIAVVWLKGNHDADILPLFNKVLEQYVIEHDEQRICVIHGHQFDSLLRKYPASTALMSRLYYYFQLVVKSNKFREFIKYRSKSWLKVIGRVRHLAIEYAKQHHYSHIVCGHTHHAEITQVDGVTYVNSGDFMYMSCGGVMITLDDGPVKIQTLQAIAPCKDKANRHRL
ncbi:MAG: UDP-2,3-diacylglucosamine diphosphatase [Calditrichota bacterium]